MVDEPEVKPDVVFSAENLPKTKEEWNGLREKDPSLWGDLSQRNFDKLFSEKKELQKTNEGLENQKNNRS